MKVGVGGGAEVSDVCSSEAASPLPSSAIRVSDGVSAGMRGALSVRLLRLVGVAGRDVRCSTLFSHDGVRVWIVSGVATMGGLFSVVGVFGVMSAGATGVSVAELLSLSVSSSLASIAGLCRAGCLWRCVWIARVPSPSLLPTSGASESVVCIVAAGEAARLG